MFGLKLIISTQFVVAVKSDLTCDPVIGSRALDQITSITSLITHAALTVAYGVRLQVTDLTPKLAFCRETLVLHFASTSKFYL